MGSEVTTVVDDTIGLRSGVFDLVWAAAENYSRADYADLNTLSGYLEDGVWSHHYPIFHGLVHRRIEVP